jgi:hypothetical protein
VTTTTVLEEMDTMKIVNTIGWRTPWLRRVVAFCCRELDYPSTGLAGATFRKAGQSIYRGRADLLRREIRIKINGSHNHWNRNVR